MTPVGNLILHRDQVSLRHHLHQMNLRHHLHQMPRVFGDCPSAGRIGLHRWEKNDTKTSKSTESWKIFPKNETITARFFLMILKKAKDPQERITWGAPKRGYANAAIVAQCQKATTIRSSSDSDSNSNSNCQEHHIYTVAT